MSSSTAITVSTATTATTTTDATIATTATNPIITAIDMDVEMLGLDDSSEQNRIDIYYESHPLNIYSIPVGTYPVKFYFETIYFTDMIENDVDLVVNANASDNSRPICIPLIINNITTDVKENYGAFEFVAKYMQMHEQTEEYPEPAKPFTDDIVNDWMKNDKEKKTFEKYVNHPSKTDSIIQIHIRELCIIVMIANYFGMTKLVQKICCLIATYLKGKNAKWMQKFYFNPDSNVIAFAQ